MCFVGPDNGLLVAAAEAAGEAPVAAVGRAAPATPRRPTAAPPSTGATSSRPAAAALCAGAALADLGEPIDPDSLVRLIGGVVEQGRLHDGRPACAPR